VVDGNNLDLKDEAGWKLVSGDVFRAPSNSRGLVVHLGSGVQIIATAVVTLMLAALGFLSPASRCAAARAASAAASEAHAPRLGWQLQTCRSAASRRPLLACTPASARHCWRPSGPWVEKLQRCRQPAASCAGRLPHAPPLTRSCCAPHLRAGA
jgi:hypothetical protein